MGICGSRSLTAEERAAAEKSKKIDASNEQDFHQEDEKIKLLLLGAGESGKSTVIKQMRLLYGADYSDEEKESFRLSIHQNIIETMELLCEAVIEKNPYDSITYTNAFKTVKKDADAGSIGRVFPDLTPQYVALIKELWNSWTIQQLWKNRSQLQVIDSTEVFINRIDEVSKPDYKPGKDDIILARARTSGIKEERLQIDNRTYCFFDVGGQRNERRKWINCFEGVNGVIFVAALSEFDQQLWEENDVNRMTEALDLFERTIHEEAFRRAAIFLFLNKIDLFEEKIKHVNIADVPAFKDYTGKPHDFDDGYSYFVNKFLKRNTIHSKIYYHPTTATDTECVSLVFDACKEIAITNALKAEGFISDNEWM